jgi:DNA-directed RNA polymerase specialized sigma24 family protein
MKTPKLIQNAGINVSIVANPAKTFNGEQRSQPAIKDGEFFTESEKNGEEENNLSLEEVYIKHRRHVLAFVRWKRGYSFHDAEDLTQAFFLHLQEKDILKRADSKKGSLETFLNAVLANFLNNEWNRQNSVKRGGEFSIISIFESEDSRFEHYEPIDFCTPRQIIDQYRAATIVEEIVDLLRREYDAKKKTALCRNLEGALFDELPMGLTSDMARSLRMTEGALRVSIHRLRRRFGELLRLKISASLGDQADIENSAKDVIVDFAKTLSWRSLN